MEEDNNRTSNQVQRRNYLKIAGSAALLGSMPGISGAKSIGETVTLIEVSLRVQEGYQNQCHIPLPDHIVSPGEKIVLLDPSDTTLEKISNNDRLSYGFEEDQKYTELPSQMFKGQQRIDLTTSLNSGLLPSNKISATEPVAFPTIVVKSESGNDVMIRCGNKKVRIGPRSQKSIMLGGKQIRRPPRTRNGDPEPEKITPEVVARNTGELDVEVYKKP